MLCKNCYMECMRIVVSLQGRAVPLNCLGCVAPLGQTCDKSLHDELCKLIDLRRKERWKTDSQQ